MTRIQYTTDGSDEREITVDYRTSSRQAWREAVRANGGKDVVVIDYQWIDAEALMEEALAALGKVLEEKA